MFLCAAGRGSRNLRFPRIRGDVPQQLTVVFGRHLFSPHTRGCSDPARGVQAGNAVFPAYAGIFRFFT